MRFVSTGVHGVIDYLTALLLMASPWLFGFADYDYLATAIPVLFGAVLLGYSLFTSYELGMTRDGLSMRTHLWLDALSGIVLMVSPWALGFADDVYVPHVAIGASELLFALITRAVSGVEKRRNNDRNHGAGSRDAGSAGTTNIGGSGTTTPRGTGLGM